MGKMKNKTSNATIDIIHPDVMRVYRDALQLYDEASANIETNGAVTGHPKTGAPMVNPYLDVLDTCSKTILKFHNENPMYAILSVHDGS